RGEKFLADERARPPPLKNKRVYVSYVPYGVVGIIGPWNFPFNLTIGEAIPALMAGNAVVLKPSEVTPGSAVLGAELARAAGLPPDVLQVVTGYGDTGQRSEEHTSELQSRFDLVCRLLLEKKKNISTPLF